VLLTPAKDGAILMSLGEWGIMIEGRTGFAELLPDVGDDRSFLIPAVKDCP
jgi:hypothetical protein